MHHLFRAALVPAVALAVVAGCGAEGTTGAAEPAAIASERVAATPTPETTKPQATQPQTAKPKPTTTRKIVVEFRTIPFKKETVTDDSLPEGEKSVTTTGANGTRRLTYQLTFVNGVRTSKTLLRQEVAKQPRTQITTIGTKVEESEESCDPNYSGGCVPIASDVDCSGGSGNGPAYVRGPVTVVGTDIYDLDRDSDGQGCED
ncbi:surface rod structure-forming protein G [Kribbella antiqua]|uniref:Surface rod structure-forming protein G n=1 Tax=Kribbella antiqua TaxID=2512217 RepID=A0A4R2IGM6_9ACTN|nr:G5 domain-containing protein [Kribbella antiqua]TCO43567.1 surface rod structure-forming protein G [Kribbella antiqua]